MLSLAIPIVAISALSLVVIMSMVFFIFFRKYKEKLALLDVQIQSDAFLINDLQAKNVNIQQKLADIDSANVDSATENNQVTKQLEHRIKLLQNQLLVQEQKITQWQESQSQDKFYTRAFKLAEKGADIEEIISECELPRAEVEMLLAVYQQRSRVNKL